MTAWILTLPYYRFTGYAKKTHMFFHAAPLEPIEA